MRYIVFDIFFRSYYWGISIKSIYIIGDTKINGYKFYHFRGCSGRDEIFSGKLNRSDIDRCKAKCDNNDNCVSFEYWGESNPHWKLGEGVCHVSSSCIFERSARKEKEGKGPNCNLYIKGEDIIRFDTLFSQPRIQRVKMNTLHNLFCREFWRQQQFKLITKQKIHRKNDSFVINGHRRRPRILKS